MINNIESINTKIINNDCDYSNNCVTFIENIKSDNTEIINNSCSNDSCCSNQSYRHSLTFNEMTMLKMNEEENKYIYNIKANEIFRFEDIPFRGYEYIYDEDLTSLWDFKSKDQTNFAHTNPNATLTDFKGNIHVIQIINMYKEKKLFAIEFKLLSEYVIPKNISNGSLFIDSIGKLK
jgi:hypothetical protein